MRAATKAIIRMQEADAGVHPKASATLPARLRQPPLHATTVDQLRAAFPGREDAAERVAVNDAVDLWLIIDRATRHDLAAASDAHQLASLEHLAANGWEPPSWPGAPPRQRLADLSPDARADAERIAADTVEDWLAATDGVLSPACITRTHQLIVRRMAAAEAAAAKAAVPADPATPKEPA